MLNLEFVGVLEFLVLGDVDNVCEETSFGSLHPIALLLQELGLYCLGVGLGNGLLLNRIPVLVAQASG